MPVVERKQTKVESDDTPAARRISSLVGFADGASGGDVVDLVGPCGQEL